jgi:hypothetical protein
VNISPNWFHLKNASLLQISLYKCPIWTNGISSGLLARDHIVSISSNEHPTILSSQQIHPNMGCDQLITATYRLTARSTDLLQKLTHPQLVTELQVFYGNRRFVNMSLSSPTWIQSQPIRLYTRTILILTSKWPLSHRFHTQTLCVHSTHFAPKSLLIPAHWTHLCRVPFQPSLTSPLHLYPSAPTSQNTFNL